MASFTDQEIEQIASADDLHISPLREDGVTPGTPTWIWSVVVHGGLYVRAYNGVKSRWYKAARSRGKGRVTVAGLTRDVTFEPVDGPINDAIDEAYRRKYATSPYLTAMIGARAKAATVRIA